MALESKDEADARKARAEADRAEAEAREYTSAPAAALREAERRGAQLKAEGEAVGAAANRWSSLVPDLTAVERGTTTVSGETAMYESVLVAKALRRACEAIAQQLAQVGGTVLVTTEADLVAGDGVYRQVSTALTELDAAADRLLPQPGAESFALPVLGLAAAALPSVLSMFATSHAISVSSAAPSAAVASTALAGVLAAQGTTTVLHDTFRMLQNGPIDDQVTALMQKCEQLREVAATPAPTATGDPRVALAADLVKRIDTFLAAVTAVPTGATRSLLTSARARQCLHGPDPVHVLLVQEAAATTSQLVDSKVGQDPFEVVASVTLPWLLVRSDAEGVVAAGTATGTAKAQGRIHGDVTLS